MATMVTVGLRKKWRVVAMVVRTTVKERYKISRVEEHRTR